MFDINACKVNETNMKIVVNSQLIVAALPLTLLRSHHLLFVETSGRLFLHAAH